MSGVEGVYNLVAWETLEYRVVRSWSWRHANSVGPAIFVYILSPPQWSLCVEESRAGEKEKESARGTMGRGKRGPLPIVPRALSIFSIIGTFIGILSGSLCGGERYISIISSICISPSLCRTIVFHSSVKDYFYTIGESQAISFNATDPEKQTQQLCIQKVDANSHRGELLWTSPEQRQNNELKFSASNKEK